MNEIKEYDIKAWVEEAPNEANLEFREAVHTILGAIAADVNLKANMVLKGGILLAIRYQSHRYTKDMDFSTEKKLGGEITEDKIAESLNQSLSQMVEELDYDLDCRVQSTKLQPKNPESTFPSIKMKIGYAYKGTPKHKRLLALKSPDIISIDYSLNEATPNVEDLKLDFDEGVLAYTLTDLIAEKYRSLLQQVERNRARRQDVYDLNLLIDRLDDQEKSIILDCLISKSRARGIDPEELSFDDPELRERAERDYLTLEDEVDGELPDFNEIFEKVSAFYKSLPWGSK
ncbi:MAG: nucleotidyl transferase AbiEii/AbiGii toxin family protein [Candidatus Thiodiazotropha sp. 4PDIV1]